MPPSISVVIPAFNAEYTITACLTALESQTYAACEIIVVDDGSCDATVALAERKAMVVPNTHGKGAGGARNTGAHLARGEIIAFIDSDCVPSPDWLYNIVRAFEEKEVVAVAGGYSHHVGSSFIGTFAFLELNRRRRRFPSYVSTAVSNNFAVKKDIFFAARGFPEIFRRATLEDMVLSYRISRLGKIKWLRDNGVGHHFHETIRGYLRQQFFFALDTVKVYWQNPEMMRVKTHQGIMIYLETFLTALTMVCIGQWQFFLSGLMLIYLMNTGLLMDIHKECGFRGVGKAVLFIPLKDVNLVIATIAGFFNVFISCVREGKK